MARVPWAPGTIDAEGIVKGRARRGLFVLSTLAVVLGLVALIKARDVGFTEANPPKADPGAMLFGIDDDLPWGAVLQFSPLGALLTLVLGALAIAGTWLRARVLVLLASAGFVACGIQVLAQFGQESNVLGGRGGNLGVFIAFAVGFAVLASAPVIAEERSI
jgi:hypothetical protein